MAHKEALPPAAAAVARVFPKATLAAIVLPAITAEPKAAGIIPASVTRQWAPAGLANQWNHKEIKVFLTRRAGNGPWRPQF